MARCMDCGFLCVTGQAARRISSITDAPAPEAPVYIEVTRQARRLEATGFTGRFACFADEPQFEEDVENRNKARHGSMQPVFEKERDCKSFYDYVLGHSPKEHVMLKLQERLEEREDKRDKLQLEWQERQEKNAADRHIELLKVAKSGLFWEVAVVGIVATLIVAVVTIAAALIENGSWTLPWVDSQAPNTAAETPQATPEANP